MKPVLILCTMMRSFFIRQRAVQEKFRQATEGLDDLNGWLDRVEREVAGQQILSEDLDSLKSQIKAIKVKSDSYSYSLNSLKVIMLLLYLLLSQNTVDKIP
jgi:hypothetical protein